MIQFNRIGSWSGIFLAAALAATVPLKLMYRPGAENKRPNPTPSIVAFLARHGYQPQVENGPGGDNIYGTADGCRVLIRRVVDDGSNLDVLVLRARAVGSLVFVFNGVVSTAPPLTAWLIRHYVTRLGELMGLQSGEFPMLAVAAPQECAVDTLPWRELAEIK
jgi:hypothetical protein